MGLDLLLMLGGFIGGLINKSMDNAHEFKQFMASKSFKDVQKAREVTNPHIAWTRRVLAIMIISAYVLLPTIVNVFWGLPTFVGYQETNGWLVSLFSGDLSVVWEKLPAGFVMTPGLEALAFTVVGFYFGKSRF